MTQPLIRRAVPADHAALEALQRRAWLEQSTTDDRLLADPDALRVSSDSIQNGRVWLCERARGLLGFMIILPRSDGQAELDGVFVEPRHWRQGVGRQLLGQAVEMAREDGCRSLHVLTRSQATGFYDGCGFRTDGVDQTRFGPAIRMILDL